MKQVEFIHVPKNGGQSAWKTLGIPSPGHRKLEDIQLNHRRLEDLFIMAHLRCPLDRAMSTYFFLTQSPDINFNTPRRWKLFSAGQMINDFDISLNEFWEKTSTDLHTPVHLLRPQHTWFTNASAKRRSTVRMYDFARWDSFIDDVESECGITCLDLPKKFHATTRPRTLDALSAKSQERIKQIYAHDFRFLDRHKIKHQG